MHGWAVRQDGCEQDMGEGIFAHPMPGYLWSTRLLAAYSAMCSVNRYTTGMGLLRRRRCLERGPPPEAPGVPAHAPSGNRCWATLPARRACA